MATYPNNIFSPREKQNRSGVEYDPEKKTVIFVEDIKKLDDEVVAIEEELGLHFKRDRMDPNLVLYLPFEENTGTMTKDLSGWGNHGALINGPSWTNGKVGKCLSFDGVDDYVNRATCSGLSTSAITIEFWSKQAGTKSSFMHPIGVFGGHKVTVYIFPNSYTYNYKFNIGGTRYDEASIATLDGNWHHIVMTFDGSKIKCYVDSVLKVDKSAPGSITKTDDSVFIGTTGTGSSHSTNYFKGLIDEVRIYNRALTASEVKDHYLNP